MNGCVRHIFLHTPDMFCSSSLNCLIYLDGQSRYRKLKYLLDKNIKSELYANSLKYIWNAYTGSVYLRLVISCDPGNPARQQDFHVPCSSSTALDPHNTTDWAVVQPVCFAFPSSSLSAPHTTLPFFAFLYMEFKRGWCYDKYGFGFWF